MEEARLVTLTGVAGIGKTRLALEIALRVAGRYPGGTWLAELGAEAEPPVVAQVVADAVGVAERPGVDLVDCVIEHVGDRPALLLLDNCEHVLAACAELADVLLRACAGLCLLATSQQRLGVTGERVWHVPPMSLPAADPASGTAALEESEAVKLFCERAVASHGSFTVTPESASAVAEICRRLDGIPLAIELAAARTEVLSPAQIAAHLDARFGLLTDGGRTTVARHRTLQAALDWSHDLLSSPEAVLLARLSVFAGGASLEAVQAVCTGDEVVPEQLFETVTALVAKSWVMADTSGAEARYRLLETIRHYAADRLADAGGGSDTKARHAMWFLDLAERAEPQLRGVNQPAWLAALESEHDNLRVALEWAVTNGETEVTLRLAGSLATFWTDLGHLREGREWIRTALAMSGNQPPALRAKVLRAAGALAAITGNREEAKDVFADALALSREVADEAGTALALIRLGVLAVLERNMKEAEPLLEEAVARARVSGEPSVLASALHGRGQACMFRGEAAAARPFFQECLEAAALAGDAQLMGDAVGGIAWAVSLEGDYEAAELLLTEALTRARQTGAPFATALALSFLAGVARIRGDLSRSAVLIGEGLGIAKELAAPFLLAQCLIESGRIELAKGDLDAARAHFEEGLSSGMRARPSSPALRAIVGLGEVALAAKDAAAAQAHFETAIERATGSGERLVRARALYGLAEAARLQGEDLQATPLHHQAMVLHHQVGDPVGIVDSIEAVARLAAASERHARAARLLGAAQSLRDADHVRYARPPLQQELADTETSALRTAMGEAKFDSAWQQGAGMSIDEVVDFASRGRGSRDGAALGWDSLTKTERAVAALVQQGLTNAEIGEKLFISPRTAQAHLAHIYKKLGINSRRELAREAAKHEPPVGP